MWTKLKWQDTCGKQTNKTNTKNVQNICGINNFFKGCTETGHLWWKRNTQSKNKTIQNTHSKNNIKNSSTCSQRPQRTHVKARAQNNCGPNHIKQTHITRKSCHQECFKYKCMRTCVHSHKHIPFMGIFVRSIDLYFMHNMLLLPPKQQHTHSCPQRKQRCRKLASQKKKKQWPRDPSHSPQHDADELIRLTLRAKRPQPQSPARCRWAGQTDLESKETPATVPSTMQMSWSDWPWEQRDPSHSPQHDADELIRLTLRAKRPQPQSPARCRWADQTHLESKETPATVPSTMQMSWSDSPWEQRDPSHSPQHDADELIRLTLRAKRPQPQSPAWCRWADQTHLESKETPATVPSTMQMSWSDSPWEQRDPSHSPQHDADELIRLTLRAKRPQPQSPAWCRWADQTHLESKETPATVPSTMQMSWSDSPWEQRDPSHSPQHDADELIRLTLRAKRPQPQSPARCRWADQTDLESKETPATVPSTMQMSWSDWPWEQRDPSHSPQHDADELIRLTLRAKRPQSQSPARCRWADQTDPESKETPVTVPSTMQMSWSDWPWEQRDPQPQSPARCRWAHQTDLESKETPVTVPSTMQMSWSDWPWEQRDPSHRDQHDADELIRLTLRAKRPQSQSPARCRWADQTHLESKETPVTVPSTMQMSWSDSPWEQRDPSHSPQHDADELIRLTLRAKRPPATVPSTMQMSSSDWPWEQRDPSHSPQHDADELVRLTLRAKRPQPQGPARCRWADQTDLESKETPVTVPSTMQMSWSDSPWEQRDPSHSPQHDADELIRLTLRAKRPQSQSPARCRWADQTDPESKETPSHSPQHDADELIRLTLRAKRPQPQSPARCRWAGQTDLESKETPATGTSTMQMSWSDWPWEQRDPSHRDQHDADELIRLTLRAKRPQPQSPARCRWADQTHLESKVDVDVSIVVIIQNLHDALQLGLVGHLLQSPHGQQHLVDAHNVVSATGRPCSMVASSAKHQSHPQLRSPHDSIAFTLKIMSNRMKHCTQSNNKKRRKKQNKNFRLVQPAKGHRAQI